MAIFAMAMLPAAGCFDDATEVVVVVDTDLSPTELGSMSFTMANGANGAGFGPSASFTPGLMQLPATVGVVPSNGVVEFNLSVQVWGVQGGFGPPPGVMGGPSPLVTRKASHVRFIQGQQLLLFLPIARKCECAGTSCPHALDVECRELMSPSLPSFDPQHLPRFASSAP